MKLALVVAGACLVGAVAAPKDRGAMIVYDGSDRVLALMPNEISANQSLVMLHQMRGEALTRPQLANRPCIGVALFSKREWSELLASGRRPDEIRPVEATMRLRVYPARPGFRAAIENIAEGRVFVATGVELADSAKGSFSWPLQVHLDSARGPCTAR